jgi:hypothetical protein
VVEFLQTREGFASNGRKNLQWKKLLQTKAKKYVQKTVKTAQKVKSILLP